MVFFLHAPMRYFAATFAPENHHFHFHTVFRRMNLHIFESHFFCCLPQYSLELFKLLTPTLKLVFTCKRVTYSTLHTHTGFHACCSLLCARTQIHMQLGQGHTWNVSVAMSNSWSAFQFWWALSLRCLFDVCV